MSSFLITSYDTLVDIPGKFMKRNGRERNLEERRAGEGTGKSGGRKNVVSCLYERMINIKKKREECKHSEGRLDLGKTKRQHAKHQVL